MQLLIIIEYLKNSQLTVFSPGTNFLLDQMNYAEIPWLDIIYKSVQIKAVDVPQYD